jgi:hypothetical protein
MRSYHCSKCNVNWPPEDDYKSCPDCKQYTFASTIADPDSAGVVIHAAVGTQTSGGSEAHRWRVERYLELGFTEIDSQLLALAKAETEVPTRGGRTATYSAPLNWQDVKATLDKGATHAQAVAIYT